MNTHATLAQYNDARICANVQRQLTADGAVIEVTWYRAYRELKNGGLVALDVSFAVTNTDAVFLPAKWFKLSNEEALQIVGTLGIPVLVDEGAVFIDIRHAEKLCDNPISLRIFDVFRDIVLLRYRP